MVVSVFRNDKLDKVGVPWNQIFAAIHTCNSVKCVKGTLFISFDETPLGAFRHKNHNEEVSSTRQGGHCHFKGKPVRIIH
jgi:hypothetical protein